MIATPIAARRSVTVLIVTTVLAFARVAFPQCAGISEEGRWRNTDKNGEPSYIYIEMTGGCGDQVLNGQQTGSSVHYSMRVWVKQPDGKFYGRPKVKAEYWFTK